MKPSKVVQVKRYRQFEEIIAVIRPATIIEIGTNRGDRAEYMCREALKYRDAVHYTGYDLFEDTTPELNELEKNKKPPTNEAEVRARLATIPGVTFELVKGNTRKTLHGTEIVADLVFIDGGHSVETIRGDYEAVKWSSCIVFDDYYTAGVDTTKHGCNEVLKSEPHELMPREDTQNGTSIKLAVIGYSAKWWPAFKRMRDDKPNIKTFAVWRPGFKRIVTMLAVLNELEKYMEVEPVLDDIREHCVGIFFTIKEDGLRRLPWWRHELEKRFSVHEWFGGMDDINGPTTEVCGTASKLLIIGELNAVGVLAEDDRFENVKANVQKTKKRLPPPPENFKDTPALIVCYGPSLNATWTDLASQLKFHGGDVFSVSGVHDYLLRRDIVPKYHVECDPRPHKTENLKNPVAGVEYLIASCCHPSLVDKLTPYDLTLWHMCNGEESFRAIDELEPDQFMVHGGGNAGLRAIAVAYVMGYRDFIIYGMDCSFDGDKEWAGPHAGKKKKQHIEVVCDGEKFQSSSVMVSYARHFCSTVEHAPGARFSLVGHGLLQAMIRAGNKLATTDMRKANPADIQVNAA